MGGVPAGEVVRVGPGQAQVAGVQRRLRDGTVGVPREYGDQVIISYAGVAPADNPQYAD